MHSLDTKRMDILVGISIGSSGWEEGGAKKHEVYVAAFGDHLFYDLFLQGWGGGTWPPRHPPGSATGHLCQESEAKFCIP